jgi:hypothetical protein
LHATKTAAVIKVVAVEITILFMLWNSKKYGGSGYFRT